MQNFLNELNPVQFQAVTTIDGPSLIIAGPGSGKTRVLTYRIAYLLEQGIPPHEILALTFTNKAAREMKERIERVVGPKAHSVWAGTFHSIFARILRIEATKLGFPRQFYNLRHRRHDQPAPRDHQRNEFGHGRLQPERRPQPNLIGKKQPHHAQSLRPK
jgi:superfamily I DNA/RNA helicase